METETTTATVTLTCACTVCADLPDVIANARVLEGVPAGQRQNIAHTYVQYAAGTSPLAKIMCGRYGAQQITA